MTDLATLLSQSLGDTHRIERELGGGGMSRVFVAEEVALGRRVVIKVLPPDMAASVNTERFRREIKLAAQLQHPGIVPLLAAGANADLLWYSMPFVEGSSLRARLTLSGAMPLDEAVRAWRDLLEALEYAHSHGIVHRDIKPENIMLAGRHAVVLDFGVAKAVSASTGAVGAGMTGLGMAIGTPAYMAPEQVAGEVDADGRLDLYAAGLVMYEMLTGRKPFDASTASELMAAHVAQPPQPILQHRQGVPTALEALVMQCLAKSPNDRPASASVVLQQLESLSGEISQARTPHATRTGTALPRRASNWKRWAIAAGVVGAALVGGVYYTQRQVGANADFATLADSSRLFVIMMPAVHDASDSVLAQDVSSTLLAAMQRDRRILPTSQEQALSWAMEIGIDPAKVSRDTLLAIGRDVGAHVSLLPTIARVGGGFLISAEARTIANDSVLLRAQVPANDAGAIPDAMRRLSEQMIGALAGAFGKIERPVASGQLFGTTPVAARLWSEAGALADNGDLLRAVDRLREALRDDSTFAPAWTMLSIELTNLGVHQAEQVEAMEQAYRHRATIRSAWARSLTEAQYLRRIGDYEGAIRALRAGSLTTRGQWAGLTENELALANSAMRRFDVAQRYYGNGRDSTFRAPNVVNRNYNVMLLERGLVDTARRELARYDSLAGPGNPVVARMHSEFAFATGDLAGAVKVATERVVKARSDAARIQAGNLLRNALVSAGQLDSARVIDNQLRALAEARGDTAAVLQVLANAAIIDAEIAGDTTAGARLTAMAGDARWQSLASFDRPYAQLATGLASTGRTSDARRVLDEWQRAVPAAVRRVEGWRIAGVRGEVLLAEKKPLEALAAFRAGDSTNCESCAWPQYARAYDAMGKRDSAIYWYERYVQRVSMQATVATHPRMLARAYKRLGELHEEAGNVERARQRYSDLVELWKNADPSLQGAVESAKARLDALQRKR